MSYLVIFGLAFEKTIVIFEISTFKFVIMQSFMLNKKDKFGCQIALLGCLDCTFEFIRMQVFMLNKKKVVTKITLYGYF